MLLIVALITHFLLALRSATLASAQQTDTATTSFSFPHLAQDTSRRLPISSSTPSATDTSVTSSLPGVLGAADATTTTTTTTHGATTETWPIHSLFLPILDPGNLAASIISVHPNHIAYALGCLTTDLRPANATSCPLSPSMTITEGVSTVVYTSFFGHDEISPLTPSAVRISCALFAPPDDPAGRASKAACTAHSTISGLGEAAATTTLASTEIRYVAVTVTDGLEKLMATATPVSGVGGGGDQGEGEGEENAAGERGVGWMDMGLLLGFVVLVGGMML